MLLKVLTFLFSQPFFFLPINAFDKVVIFFFFFCQIDENVQREIINHRSLRHPNIVRFKEVILTPSHLAIVMEYASGGELYDRICNAGRFSEDEVCLY